MSNRTSLPSPEDLIPHSDSMLLLESIDEHSPDRTICRVNPVENDVFLEDDTRMVPPWVSLEYMGQAACAHVMLKTHDEETPPVGGILISAKDINLDFEGFRTDRSYLVEATQVFAQERLQSCECSIREAGTSRKITTGRLNALVSEDLDDLGGI